MATELTRADAVGATFSHAFLSARAGELELLNAKLKDSFEEASRDAEELR